MARTPKRKGFAKMRNVIAERAGMALARKYAGPHRDKLIARDFSVSVRTAQYLQRGQHWTLDRLAQASAAIGAAFDIVLAGGAVDDDQHYAEMGEIRQLSELAERVGRLERQAHEQLVASHSTGLASQESPAPVAFGAEASGDVASLDWEGRGARAQGEAFADPGSEAARHEVAATATDRGAR